MAAVVVVLAVAGGCSLFDSGPGDDGGAESTGDGGAGITSDGGPPDDAGVECPGVAYTRTDVPGTALCLDGAATFECAWGTGNAAVDGYMVQGNHDAANDRLTLLFPDDPSNTSFTEFVFDMLYAVDGVDLVLVYMGSRTGEYREVESWAEAAAGDQGVCGGTPGAGGGDTDGGTCERSCSSDADCGAGEACLSTNDGELCLPSECQDCFADGQGCNFYVAACEFDECTPPPP